MNEFRSFIRRTWLQLLRNLGIVTVVDLGEGASLEELAVLSREVESVSNHQKSQDEEIDSAKKRLAQQETTLRALKAQVGVNVPHGRRREPTKSGDDKHS